MNTIEFEGHLIFKDKIVAVDKVTSFNNWELGFVIRFAGNNLVLTYPRSDYLDSEENKAKVNRKRDEFIALLNND